MQAAALCTRVGNLQRIHLTTAGLNGLLGRPLDSMDSIRCGGAITTPILPDEFGCSAITTPRLRDGLRGPVGPPGVQEALHQWPTLAALAAPTLAALAALALYQWPASGGLGGANFGNFGLSSGFVNLSSASTQVLHSVSVVVASPLVVSSSR